MRVAFCRSATWRCRSSGGSLDVAGFGLGRPIVLELELDLAAIKPRQHRVLLLARQRHKTLFVGGVGIVVQRPKPQAIAPGRRQIALIALGGQPLGERSLHVKPGGFAEVTSQLPIDINCATGILAAQGLRVGRNDAIGNSLQRRTFARPCLDWTERRPHLAGAVGAAIAEHAMARQWVAPVTGTRALRVTPEGRRGFLEQFALNLPD